MKYSDVLAADQRRHILTILEGDPDYSHNESIIQRSLDLVGHSISTDKLRTELQWLQEQGLVEIEKAHDIWVVSLTKRGEDIALGRTNIDGISRRRPRS